MATRTKLSRLLTARKPLFGRSGSCSNGGSVLGISKMLYSSSSSSALASNECEAVGSRLIGLHLEILGVKNYVNYRRSLYGEISHKALLVDAVGTFVVPSQPMAQIYRQIGEKYGVEYSVTEILNRYSRAYEQPWGRS